MIKKIDHVGIAVDSIEEHIPFYRDVLGLEYVGIEEIPDQKVKVAVFRVGEVKIELLESTSSDGPVAKYIEKKGPGMHHISYNTDDIAGEIAGLKDNNILMIDEVPREGSHGNKIAFLHPKSSGKVLTELTEG
jgi:methylmalonyl-CoA/ethylmalonyl-CoA epimerase